MNRIRGLFRSSLVSVERFDHPEDEDHRDPAGEEAAGFAINVIEQGAFRVHAGGYSWTAAAGDVFCTAPGFAYRCEHPPGPPRDSCLTLFFGCGTEDEPFQPARWPSQAGRPVVPPANRARYAVSRLHSRLHTSTLAVEAAAFEVAAAISAGAGAPSRLYRAHQLSWYAQRVDRARERLDVEFADDHSLSSLGADAGMSPFHFARVFAELVGTPPHQYLVRRRLQVAAGRLRQGSSVSDACFESGFSSLSHFVRSFTRQHGVTPSGYRRRDSRYNSRWGEAKEPSPCPNSR